MFCLSCGTSLPDDANFCLKCGKPQKEGVQAEEARWETCEIVYRLVKKYSWRSDAQIKWLAKAVGSKGIYYAAESISFEIGNDDAPPRSDYPSFPKARAELDALTVTLTQDGWDYLGRHGPWYYDLRFRRREKQGK